MTDQEYMEFAIQLAQTARGRTSPNPLVGAVLVKDNRIVGFGAHLKAGTPHAEVHAVRMAGDEVQGSTLYVTLEPCSHFGRTPPCADLVVQSGIRSVHIAMADPNPLVAGSGIRRIQEAGIPVFVGLCEASARIMNEVFIKNMTTQLPFVAVKTAATLDGKIATATGDSKWITGEEARRFVHQLRDQFDGIMVGVGTVMQDNPQLTTRLPEGGRNPLRIVVDPNLRAVASNPSLHVFDTKLAPAAVLCREDLCNSQAARQLRSMGCQIIGLPMREGQPNVLDLEYGLRKLWQEHHLASILVEGGSALNGHLLQQSLIDKLFLFYAPKLIGASAAPGSFGGMGVETVQEAWCVKQMEIKQLGRDLCLIGYL
ncbi:bifunctional diaminohydroxyphosphoribosylaminopyrimidine deaminase/5-amino-6-(5-phosphoribosylamino)uracil reductase RibD [Fodinisporobacter ferrooxydans]|uniref:Riboflavin biosynthesis protein RibD n=1 Tax=Fodinisporobacter ferrooxydans TaxID=2901836 RepID=A0ABY4CH88_9BACL|nr:bifunctional diaminohydroxyphosphoribosylaminopyrimidine deaminase/5-amino-6-(5-phosphoribosylamino)uracil reductase RibD [Alicyclobacillaceae bacterium MYW30-H2]